MVGIGPIIIYSRYPTMLVAILHRLNYDVFIPAAVNHLIVLYIIM